MRCDDTDSSFVVVIQGGPRLDIMTQEGANQFLELFSSLGPFSTRIKSDVKPARKGIVSASSRQEIAHHGGILERSYIMFDSLANTASRHVFDSNVSTSDMRALVKHFQRVLENLTTAPQWTKTGVLHKYDLAVLVNLISFNKHDVFLKEAMTLGLLSSLAKFAEAAKNPMPCPEVSERFGFIVFNILATLGSQEKHVTKRMKIIESSGLLGQFLRCSIVQPCSDPDVRKCHLEVLDELAQCPHLISKKLVKGQQTGDIFNSVVDKFSNPRTRPHSEEGILSRLGGIKNLLAAVCTPMTLSDGSAAVTRLCRKCSKLDEDEAMLVCGICQVAFYCSRECQLDDWKAHYKICKPLDERLQKASHYRDSTLKSFLEENYFAIMSEIVDLTNEGTLTQKDLILELDFRPDGSGSARAFRDPPVFKIGRATDYLNGSRPAEPDWFLKGTDMYGNNVKPVIRGLRDQHKRVLSEGSGMLTIARQPSKLISAVRLNLFCGSDNQSLFSDKAIRSFQRCRNLLHTFGEVDDFDDEFSGGMKTIILRHHRSSLQWLSDTISRLGEEDILDHNEDTHSTFEEE